MSRMSILRRAGRILLTSAIAATITAAGNARSEAAAISAGSSVTGGTQLSAAGIAPNSTTQTLSYAAAEGYWIAAGGPADVADIAAAIAVSESSLIPGAIQQGEDYCSPSADSQAGWGLWQITCGNSIPAYGTDFQLLDPWNNAEAAVAKYYDSMDAGNDGFWPWYTYRDGDYTNHLHTDVAAATQLTDPGEYTQVGSTPVGTPASPAPDPGSTYELVTGSCAAVLMGRNQYDD